MAVLARKMGVVGQVGVSQGDLGNGWEIANVFDNLSLMNRRAQNEV